ncbi:arabinogalactan endo-beta-1,4-galactanase [Flavobacterium sp.]|uniref:glycoside hydrolase family 53 protein n=1 Tax=Flavobacterium sp. TaxID=239 RepID=UPI0037516BCE
MKTIKKTLKLSFLVLLTLNLVSCSSSDSPTPTPTPVVTTDDFIRAADVSYLPLIESEGTIYKHNGVAENALTTLKNAGCNTIRIRLWKDPSDVHSGLAEVKTLALRAKNLGMKVWLTVHYSDTWADPANQTKPVAWQSLSFSDLKIAVANYTSTILTEIQPDIFQIGNETNDGMIWPEGKLSTNESQYLQLLQTASTTIRSQAPITKIMLHYAGISGSDYYFDKVKNINYDYIGLSYYPIWHGKSLVTLQNTMNSLGNLYNKKVVIAETAYPFTFGYNDYTNNIVGLPSQIIPDYPATNDGQKNYLSALKTTIKQSSKGIGFCYWGSEWVAFRGPTSTNGSSWENQSLWDFNNNSLPVLDVFSQN